MHDWIYNEFKHSGVDYSDAHEAENYDRRHEQFRDFEKEFAGMLSFLCLENPGEMSMIDLGCGTGVFTTIAAEKFKKVFAVDVSEIMIEQAKTKINQNNTGNVEFIHSGFLSYKHSGEPVDLIISKVAFHHLPDFWKQAALLNMNKMLKPGGILYINDVVFNFPPANYKEKINGWISEFELKVSKEFTKEIKTHIRDEYSTFTWILEGMIKRAGFEIEKKRHNDDFMAEYKCNKIDDVY